MPGKVVTQEEWLTARKELLIKEKEHTRATDNLTAQLRDFPMVQVDQDYTFHTSEGKDVTLADLFKGKKQLIIYHFMLSPDQDLGCTGCTFFSEHVPDTRLLQVKDTTFTAVSRAPMDKISAYKKKLGWTFPWVSAFGSTFNYDYNVTDPAEYNYAKKDLPKGEYPGLSVFYKDGGNIYHTYSSYGRGLDRMLGTFTLLDMTPLGRQVSSQGPGEFKRKYEFEEEE